MAYQTGYVDDTGSEGIAHHQLLLTIKALAEANGWTTLRYDDTLAKRELILQSAGTSGTDDIYVGFRTYDDAGADVYNLSVAGFTGYVAGNSFDTQPGYMESGIPGHNQRIDYWITANANRLAFALKVGTPVYESGFVGLFLPYATPGQYPYPLLVAGMLDGIPLTRFSDTSHSMPWKGNRANLRMRFVDGSWLQPKAWPWTNSYLAGTTQLRDNGGQYGLEPVTLCDDANTYGEAGVDIHFVSGFNNTVESVVQIGGTTVDPTGLTTNQLIDAIAAAGGVPHLVVQDVGRTGFTDYYALGLN